MSNPTTGIGFSPTTPAAPTGNQNVVPQGDNGAPLESFSFAPQKATGSLLGVVKPDGVSIVVDGAGKLTATGVTVVGFVLNNGATGTNIGPMLVAPAIGSISSCVVVTKASDASIPFQFDIKKNGTSVFTGTLPTVSAATSSGTVSTFTSLTSVPLSVAKGDVFTINVIQGSSSWQATVQLES